MKHLGITPGSRSLLSLLNDKQGRVELVMDKVVADAESLQCHPLVNTATLVVQMPGIQQFLRKTGHQPSLVEVPALS